MRRSAVHLVLAVLLLLTQQLALVHTLGHVFEGRTTLVQAEQGPAGPEDTAKDRVCDLCLSFAQVGHTAASRHYTFALPELAVVRPLEPQLALHAARAPPPFRSRAPPSSLA